MPELGNVEFRLQAIERLLISEKKPSVVLHKTMNNMIGNMELMMARVKCLEEQVQGGVIDAEFDEVKREH